MKKFLRAAFIGLFLALTCLSGLRAETPKPSAGSSVQDAYLRAYLALTEMDKALSIRDYAAARQALQVVLDKLRFCDASTADFERSLKPLIKTCEGTLRELDQ